MANSTPAPVWITGPTGAVTFVNNAFAEVAGVPCEQLLGDSWINLLHPDDLAGVAERRAEAWRNNHAPYEFVARFRTASGDWRWMRASAQPRFGERGEFHGYVGMAVDETVARKAVADLRESEARLRLVQEAAGIASLDWNMITDETHRSSEFIALHGMPADTPLDGAYNEAWLKCLHPEDRDTVIACFREAIQKPGAFEIEYRIVRADNGETRWIQSRARVEGDDNGEPVRLISAQSDITRQKETEFALRAAKERLEQRVSAVRTQRDDAEEVSREVSEQFRLLVQGVVDYALFLIDPMGRVTTWNAGAARIKGYTPDEIIGRHFSVFYTPEDRDAGEPAVALETARRTGRYEKEGWRVRKDGTCFVANVIIDAITDDNGKLIGFAKITRDVTEQRKAQRELEETRSALVQSQKMEMVGQLTGGLAHDFNNMLAGIIGALNLMQRRIAAGRYAELGKYVDAALASSHRAASLTARLLAFGRRQSLDIMPVDIAAAVRSMEILLTRSIGENIRVNFNLGPATALTDPNQFETALLNLAVNARDAMPDGGELTIETGVASDEFVSVVVSDTGAGMDAGVLEKAFDPFFTTKPIGQGTGLGLSMVHGFVNQSGGSITIASAPGKGTSVRLLLPVSRAAPADTPTRNPDDIPSGAGETVLVVEDDAQVRMLVLEVLRELGYATLEAQDAREALALLEQAKVDLLVSDVGLPGMNGRQLAELARARAPTLRVLFMTGYAEHARVRSSFLDKGMDLITKPFDLDVLADKVREMMIAD